MSLTRDHGDIVFECDSCRDTLETRTANFEAARNLLKRAHWQPYRRKDSDDWSHRCHACCAPLMRNGREVL
jgi:hypothetical protein